MKKVLCILTLLCAVCTGAWASGPFTFRNWNTESWTLQSGSYVFNYPIYMQQDITVSSASTIGVTFTFNSTNSPNKRLDMFGVDVVNAAGEVVASDYHEGYAGSNVSLNTYTLSNVPAGNYTMRYWSARAGEGNSNLFNGSDWSKGTITHSGATISDKTWNTKDNQSDWVLTPAGEYPYQLFDLIKTKTWTITVNSVAMTQSNVRFHDDTNLTFSEPGQYMIVYAYTGADGNKNNRLDMFGVELLDENNKICAFEYVKRSSGDAGGTTGKYSAPYVINVPKAGTYTLRSIAQGSSFGCLGDVMYVSPTEVYSNIANGAVGYPKSNAGFPETVKHDNVETANTALKTLLNSTDINLPTPGKAYKIAFNGSNGSKYYIKSNGENPTTNAENAAIVVVGDKGGAADAQRFYFVNSANAQWMNYQGFSNKTYTSSVHDFRVEPINKYNNTSYNNLTLSKDRSFGYVFLYATKRPNNDNNGGMVVKESDGTWSATQHPFFNGTYTSAITFEEVEFPYTTKNFNAGGDDKYYATVALPYAMEIPAGVKAYAAVAEGDVLTLTDATEASQNVPAGAYILVGSSAGSADVLPAAANPATITNELQGSITATPSGDIYVLNKVDGVGFYKFNGDNDTLLGKAYLPSSAKVSKFSFNFGEETTAISAVESERSNAEIYDLSGRKITRTQKGINIINGHKVIK